MATSKDLPSLLSLFDRRESKAVNIVEPGERYYALQQLNIEAMKLQVQYGVGSPEEQQITERRGRYSALQRGVQQEANRQLQQKYKDPFVMVQFDEFGALVRDQEALRANFVLNLRYPSEL